ncbi:LPXTG cell wall anchor domain-containing protein [Dactylosporangium sucinum]|uniref:Gram-positive cocci surface proteins LPxTG domain-containing protein n=1 Tax=Dactylosporangium sucinum TaxID=1424081 RepID=A0A917TT52_9ACTN|nr:LPXTG cell wall anchor domain-containing protein [Dactylosporangium sucinum]GGM34016.1 hypothetical protein GCM10007977_039420 [Dactylosporangium sucinum]
MTDFAFARPKTARKIAALAATGILGALSPVAFAAPAAAAPSSAGCPEGFGATAAANTLALGGVDLRGIGLNAPPLPELRVATTHSGFAGGPARAAADARYIQSSGVLPPGMLGPVAYQQAPPRNDRPSAVSVAGVNLGALSVGVGELSAHATFDDAGKCDPRSGPRATSSARLAGLAVLPGRGDRALLRLGALRSSTETAVDKRGASAAATGSIADFQLLAGGQSAIGVRVVSPPTLTVVAGSKKTVDYSPARLEVRVPGREPLRISSAGSHVDVVVPVGAAARTEAEELGRAEGLPVLSSLPLLDLLTGITGALTGGLTGGGTTPDLGLILPGLPEVGKLTGVLGGGSSVQPPAEGYPKHPAKVVVLRVELGTVEQQTSPTGVYAKAAAVRVKLIVRTKWKGHASDDGYGGSSGDHPKYDQKTIFDLGLCSLEAAAAAPKGDGYGGVGGGGGGDDGEGGGGELPVTGSKAALIVGAGLLLLVAGRFFLVVSRRRTAA